MEQIAVVTKVFEKMAQLNIKRMSACGESCKGCLAGCDIKEHIIVVPNTLNAKIGDQVELQTSDTVILKYILIMYGLPFIFLVGGMFLSHYLMKQLGLVPEDWKILVFGLLSMAVGFLGVRMVDRKFSHKNKQIIEMVRIIDDSDEINELYNLR